MSGDPIWTLKTIAKARLAPSSDLPPQFAVKAALERTFANLVPEPVSEAELAQAALDVLAEDAEFTEPIGIMLRQPQASARVQQYLEPATIATVAAAILVLQFRFKGKLDSSGKWSFEFEQKTAGDGALKILIQRLLSFLDK